MFDIVLSTPFWDLPEWTTQNQLFWTAWAEALIFSDITRNLKDNGLHGLGVPTPNEPLQKSRFWKLNWTIDFSQLGSYAELA